MSDQFSWRTDEDDGWDEPPTRPSSEAKRRRPWLWLIAAAAAALTVSLVLYLRLQEQVETATSTAEAELLAAHQLIQQAAATNDLDLFRSNLSRRDPAWADAQRALISTGLFLDRSAFGLRWWGETQLNLSDAAATPTLPITVTLSPDLLSAEVIYEEEYLLEGSGTTSQTIRLQHTAVYRRGSGRWLRADPLPEFWGALRTAEREYVTVTYSRRDETIVQRLADDFDAELQRLCLTFAELDCTTLQLELRLTRDPASFFSLVQLVDVIAPEEGEIILPAPTLVGLPLDETGYELMMKGYAAQLVAAAVTQLLHYECCHHGLFYRAFMDRLLNDMDVRPVPLVTTPVGADLHDLSQSGISSLWVSESLDYSDVTTLPYLYSLADFLIATAKPPITALNLLNGLRSDVSFPTWVRTTLSEPDASTSLLMIRWAGYIAEQNSPTQALPLPLPTGSIHLSCYAEDNSDTYRILRYDLETQHWTEEENLHQFFAPAHNGYVTVTEEPDQNQLVYVDTLNLQTAVITTTTKSDGSFQFQPNYFFSSQLYGSPPEGHFYFATLEYTLSGQPIVDHWLADLTRCETGSCAVERLAGIPIWSPDGEHLILYNDEGEELSDNLFVADGRGNDPVAIGQGYLPFWLDSSHYGYFTRDDSDQLSTVMTGEVDQTVPQAALTNVDIRRFIQPDLLPYFYLAWAMPRPQATSNTTVMLALGGENIDSTNHYYVLELQWDDAWQTVQNVQILREADHGMFPSYSPDGRYLILIEQVFSQQAYQETHLTLVNQETQAEQTYVITDFFNFPQWSKDGRWLIQITTRELVLIAPEFAIERRIPFTSTFCNFYHYVSGE